jgi:hypothetical protein
VEAFTAKERKGQKRRNMPSTKDHAEDKAKLTKTIESMIQISDQGADTDDLRELLRYVPQRWLTTVWDWAFIVQLAENAEKSMQAALASRQVLLTGIREIGQAAGAQVETAAAGR